MNESQLALKLGEATGMLSLRIETAPDSIYNDLQKVLVTLKQCSQYFDPRGRDRDERPAGSIEREVSRMVDENSFQPEPDPEYVEMPGWWRTLDGSIVFEPNFTKMKSFTTVEPPKVFMVKP